MSTCSLYPNPIQVIHRTHLQASDADGAYTPDIPEVSADNFKGIPTQSSQAEKTQATRSRPSKRTKALNIKRIAVAALAAQGAAMAPKADGLGTIGCIICLSSGLGFACTPICALALLSPTIPLF